MKVAVYGSLKKDFGNYGVMQDAKGKFLTKAITKNSNFIMDGHGFPYVVRDTSKNAGKVSVEIYEVDEDGLQKIDWLEGHPTFYKREEEVFIADGKEITAWIYIYQSPITANTELTVSGVYTWLESWC